MAENTDRSPPEGGDNGPLTIITLGMRGAGKSTLINNLLDIKDIIKVSMERGTTKIERKENQHLNAIDAPGFESSNQKEWEELLKKMVKFEDGKTDLVLLCIPVGPGFKFNNGYPKMMQTMQNILGKRVWENCIVVFTFSNYICGESDYMTLLEKNTKIFRDNLHKLGVKDVEVKTIFQHKRDPKGDCPIVTIPAGEVKDDRVNPESQQTWIEDIFDLMKDKRPDKKFSLAEYFRLRITTFFGFLAGGSGGFAVGGGMGTMAGGVIGATIGSIAGPLGTIVGGIGGAITGAVVGSPAGTVIGALIGGRIGAEVDRIGEEACDALS